MNGTVTVSFSGTPYVEYVVQASDSLVAPLWVNVSTNLAGADGLWTSEIRRPKTEHPMKARVAATGITPHASRLTPHASRLTPHASRLTPHASRHRTLTLGATARSIRKPKGD